MRGPWSVERDPQRLGPGDDVDGAADADVHLGLAVLHDADREGVLRQLDQQPRAAPGDAEAQARPADGQPGVEGEPAVAVAHAGEAEDQGAPHAAGRGDVQAVDGVLVEVGQVDVQRLPEVVHRRLVVAHLGGDDRLHDGRQRGVAGRDRVVVLEVGLLLLGREPVAVEEHRQHDVGLLEHLEAVDDQRVVVQEQGPQLGGRAGEVPHLAVEEEVVLGVDAESLVERDRPSRRRTGATRRPRPR